MQQNYSAQKIFTGETWVEDAVIITEDEIVIEIIPKEKTDASLPLIDFGNDLIVPAFIDLQIYGANKKTIGCLSNCGCFAGSV